MQNIKKFWRADPEISAVRTNERSDEWMDEAEFIGPFRLKPWVQKVLNEVKASSLQLSFNIFR